MGKANLSRLEVVHRFFSGTGLSYDRVATICTWGFDLYWKRRILAAIPGRPKRLLDQACGTGILTLDIARRFPDCEVIGVELRREYLDIARQKARDGGIENVSFLLGRAEDVLPEGEFDCITSSYLAKYADLPLLLENARQMLRPGGRLILHDFTYPRSRLFRLLWRVHFRLLQTAGSRLFPEWRTVFFELPDFLRETRWLPESLDRLERLSFEGIRCIPLTCGAAALITADTPRG
jgi:demethylmenaquinone methyltransferase / 2-methoxy-6-polyprenyl-1,4-benzoquinol methylase